jgi:hypothetical protein
MQSTINDSRGAELSASNKFWLTVLSFAAICWLGGIVFRTLIGNEFFITGTLQFSPSVSLDQERTLFQLLYASNFVVLIAYIFVLMSAIVLARTVPFTIKRNGWLLMSYLLFFPFVPVEIFTGYLDIKFILLWMNTQDILLTEGLHIYEVHSTLLRETLAHRISALAGLPVIATLSYLTAVVVLIWQPVKKRISQGSDGVAG